MLAVLSSIVVGAIIGYGCHCVRRAAIRKQRAIAHEIDLRAAAFERGYEGIAAMRRAREYER